MDRTPAETTIMVVDDTPANLKLLQDILQTSGYRVLAFPKGRMALTAAVKHRAHPRFTCLPAPAPPDRSGDVHFR